MDNAAQVQKIGLLGGSFNPAHAGHREISLEALNRLDLDVVWWLVTPGNPLKNADSYAPYEERLSTARAVANHDRIVVSDYEYKKGLQYTADTLKALIDEMPTAQFTWLMGADSLESFHKWRDWRRIANLAPIAVFNRPGYKTSALSSDAAAALAHFRIDTGAAKTLPGTQPPAWVFFNDTDNPLSSTELRQDARRKDAPPH